MTNKNKTLPLHHLLDIDSLSQDSIRALFERAQFFLQHCLQNKVTLNNLNNKVIANLFFEPSTRTRCSFALAVQRLGGILLDPNMMQSATLKGESLLDTIHAFEAMGTDLFIIRHPDNNTTHFIATELKTNASIINAGDGSHQHPTQCLLDLFTISQHKKDFKNLKVTIIGDILHSRVSVSLIKGLQKMETSRIHLATTEPMAPPKKTLGAHVTLHTSLKEGLKDADVIVTLRIQKERMKTKMIPKESQFYEEFGLTPKALSYAKPTAIIMHPGPLNRGVEIDSSVADGPQSVINEQILNGLAMRMAVIDSLLNKPN